MRGVSVDGSFLIREMVNIAQYPLGRGEGLVTSQLV